MGKYVSGMIAAAFAVFGAAIGTWILTQSDWYATQVQLAAQRKNIEDILRGTEFSLQLAGNPETADHEITLTCSDGYVLIAPICDFVSGPEQPTDGFAIGRVEYVGETAIGKCVLGGVAYGGRPRLVATALCARPR